MKRSQLYLLLALTTAQCDDQGRLDQVTVDEVADNIYHLVFPTQELLASTFLRPQEFYESPEFQGEVFSLDEFVEWYTVNSPKGKETGEFTYYTDWNGFNVPSSALDPFYGGKFNPLSYKEQFLLGLFEEDERFYVFGSHMKKPGKTRDHEMAHALFYTNPDYRAEVLEIIDSIDLDLRTEINSYFEKSGGYHPSVYPDETQAYIIASLDKLKEKGGIDTTKLVPIHDQLVEVFNRYTES